MARQQKPRRWNNDELRHLVYSAVGAASVPLWQTHPDGIMPSEEVIEAVEIVLEEYGVRKEQRI